MYNSIRIGVCMNKKTKQEKKEILTFEPSESPPDNTKINKKEAQNEKIEEPFEKKQENQIDKQVKENKKIKKKIKLKKKVYIILLFISISLLLYSSFEIVKWFLDNHNTKDTINDIKDNTKVKEKKDTENTEIIQTEEIDPSNPYWDYIKMNLLDVDFSELKKTNNQTVGWIQVKNTNINYPFVQTSDNEFYLNHSYNKSKNNAGWIFMDYRNNPTEYDDNTILYGHGRYDKTMFGSLKKILTSGWLNNSENYVVRLSTEYENTMWQVFSVYKIKTTTDYLTIYFPTPDNKTEFLNNLKNRSAYDFNTPVNANDKILTLSTCYSDSERVVLHAKLIKREKR